MNDLKIALLGAGIGLGVACAIIQDRGRSGDLCLYLAVLCLVLSVFAA